MIEQLVSLARIVGVTLGVLADGAVSSALTATGLLLVVSLAASVAVATVVVAVRLLGQHAARTSAPHGTARRALPQILIPPAQSNPDARGHSRPRAPGRLLPVA